MDPSSLVSLGSAMSCHIPGHCTAVDCCVDVDFITRSIRAFVDLDACSYTLSVGVERLQFTRLLFDYEWGEVERFYLNNVIRVE